MNTPESGPTSPTAQRITKAAFFRSRSPPIAERPNPSPHDLSARLDLQARIAEPESGNGRHSPGSSGEGLVPPSQNGMAGHTPQMNGFATPRPARPASPRSATARLAEFHRTRSVSDEDEHDDEGAMPGSASMGMASGSDEMLMTLLAGQAAVDCQELPVAGWEEVENWKKELSLLSNRLSSLVARHQREVKILAAARTLQKLNNANKRMSKQTMESLEQSEKRAEAAEKEVLVLRDREAVLRRQLMEHWSGVMAWEVRRLERVSAESQARFDRQSREITMKKNREEELSRRVQALEVEVERKAGRVMELEEMFVEMGRRERSIEEEVRELDGVKRGLDRDKERWMAERRGVERDKEGWETERIAHDQERQGWQMEKRILVDEKEVVGRERQEIMENGRMSARDRAMMERIRGGLGGILRRKSGVGEAEVVDAMEEVRSLLERRENEVVRLKEEMREVNMGLEEEVRRLSADRDGWKSKVERGEQGRKEEGAALQRQLRSHAEQISDLKLRNESLSTSLAAAQSAVSSMSTTSTSTRTLQNQVDALTAELESIAGQFNEVWSILPHRSRRVEAELIDPRTGASNTDLMSPSKNVNFEALQQVYVPSDEKFSGIDEMLNRIRGMVDDGKLLIERVVRLGKERELLKSNAAKAKKLVEDSRHSLETYQQQVAVLEDRLASIGSTESRSLEELNSLRAALDAATLSKRNTESQVTSQAEACERLSHANDDLSTRALTLADEAEREKRVLQKRLQEEIEELKRRVEEAQEEADEQRTRGQAQRIQLLDELNSLQAEVGDLRKQLRSAQRGGTPNR